MYVSLHGFCLFFFLEKVRHSKRGKKEQQQKSIQILDENESFRQSKKDKKEEEQESSENVDQSENLRQSKKDKKEEEQKSSENVDESGNVRQSKRGKKEQEKKSSENVDESENVRNLKRVKKEEQKSTENEDESGNVRQSKRRKKEQEQSLENVDERVDNVRQPKIQKKDEDQKSTENVDESGTSETTDWNEITSFEEFRIANIRPVRSRLQSMKTNKTEKRMIYMVKGDEITARVQGPDRMSVHQIGDYLTIGKSNTTQQNRKELSRLVNLIPKPTNIVPPITSAWSMLTNGDVDYQVQSLNTLTEALVDKEATKKAVCKKKKGTSAQKRVTLKKLKKLLAML
ncbi:cilia- and flagella-associated protein 251-like [Mytilus californianus]|uniref:cilia- and flagella-associated protein 251-like n=1 Tax=Mytilus californianus TaxID=6549 RepID=UPI002248171E|nr:cilia- and flagella-associated protein 251-like [Mytilus californianus]